MYFNSFYNPANIYIDNTILPTYTSYMVELWWYPDNTMAPNTSYYFAIAPNRRNYIFYTNAMRVYYNSSVNNYFVELPFNFNNPTNVSSSINRYEWNKFVFNVYKLGANWYCQFYVNNINSSAIALTAPAFSSVDQSLKYILFCHLDSSSCGSNTVYWASGIYKGLRVWNGDLAQPSSITQYND